jgi:hypothetical protein
MTITQAASVPVFPRRVALRPLAIPNEHGAWSFVLEPLVLALLIAPSKGGVALTIAIVAAFFLRHPLRLLTRDLMSRKRYPRTAACATLAGVYGAASLVFLGLAIAASSLLIALPLLLAVPFLALQFLHDVRNQGREFVAETCGAIAAAAGGAACVLASPTAGARIALVVAVLALTRSLPSILYVRALLRKSSVVPGLIAHALSCVLIAALVARLGFSPLLIAVPLLLLARCVAAQSRPSLTARRLGLEDLGWGVVVTLVSGVLV